MPESVIRSSTARKRERARRAFKGLPAVLDRNPEKAATVYVSIHRTAILFFQNNGCPEAEQLADRVMEILERKARGKKKIWNPRGLAYRIGEKLRLRAWRMLKRASPLSDAKQLAQAEQGSGEQTEDGCAT
ncbi:MAG: hypothetical protein ACR2NN_28695 [Bryobacteraceae bacterium]